MGRGACSLCAGIGSTKVKSRAQQARHFAEAEIDFRRMADIYRLAYGESIRILVWHCRNLPASISNKGNTPKPNSSFGKRSSD